MQIEGKLEMSRYIDMDTAIAIVDAVRFGQPVSRLCEMLEVSREEIERLPGFPSVCFPRGDVEINYFAEEMQDAVI